MRAISSAIAFANAMEQALELYWIQNEQLNKLPIFSLV